MSDVAQVENTSPDAVRLLVIDDDDVDRERVLRMVAQSRMNAQTTEAASSMEAIAFLKDRQFDCVVLDNQLPDGTGAELLSALRSGTDAHCPVIMVTGAGDEELAAEVMRAGAADYLSKSRLSTESLCRAITRSIDTSRMQQQLRRYASELAASEAKYRAIVEDQTELVSLAHPDLTLSYVNVAFAAHYGLTPVQMVGHNLLEYVPADERDRVRAQMRTVCQRKSAERSDTRTMSAIANVSRWVAWTHRALVDSLGSVVSIHSVGRDITDEVHGREAVSRLAAVVNSSVDAIISTNLTDEITTWNPAALHLFGYTIQQAIGKSIALIVPPDRQSEEKMLAQRVRSGEAIVEFQTVRLRRNTILVEVALTLSPIRDAGGNIVGISQIVRDISERKRLEPTFLEGERQYRELYETSPAMLHSVDSAGRLLSVSDAWLSHMGYVRNDVLGRPFTDFLSAESRQSAQERILPELLRSGRCEDVQLSMLRSNGTIIDVLLSATLTRDKSGNPSRSLAILHDVSENDPLS
jgi:PAS domain S-box-containing protein